MKKLTSLKLNFQVQLLGVSLHESIAFFNAKSLVFLKKKDMGCGQM